jgi:hypothetical protein
MEIDAISSLLKHFDCLRIGYRRSIPAVPHVTFRAVGNARTVSSLIAMSDSLGVESAHEH